MVSAASVWDLTGELPAAVSIAVPRGARSPQIAFPPVLARLATSAHRDRFVLKGGLLLAALNARRPTVDADLMATHLSNDIAEVLARVVEIAGAPTRCGGVVLARTPPAGRRSFLRWSIA
ncbi:hypothetical protein GCM10022223_44990 [Kineosporia mesophila]|uniref:Nucleotidyltransferase AbiEii toxin of type IV toxin-antitoxin system n=1 Tax=Kineosporia mesophila TaxID=566012 RepID=A0ABP7A158_9ACTN|nr:nucleotidyl transferase AbiEii/AbiGii toxin family protein [Kineosporia mesophila]